MIELKENIFLVPGENGSLFPFCNCVYLKGRDMRVLIDAGMGSQGMGECIRAGIDALILSHCHYDHRSTISDIPAVPVWCHELDAPYIKDPDLFVRGVGLSRSGLDFRKIFRNLPFQNIRIARMLHDRERIDLGGLILEILHVPGHSPGQIAVNVPKAGFLFTADVSLHPFGPFYGHDFSDIEDSIRSIRKLKGIGADTVLSGNCGPFTAGKGAEVERLFTDHEAVIYERDRRIMDLLEEPRGVEGLIAKGIVYQGADRLTHFMKWFERVHLEKHLERLERLGKIRKHGDFFQRV